MTDTKHPTKKGFQDRIERIRAEYAALPPSIRWMCKADRVRKTGTKAELALVVDRHERRARAAACIQSHCRKVIANRFITLARWRETRIEDCVNDRDFYTLDPWQQIPNPCIMFYAPPGSTQYYWFHIGSIVAVILRYEVFRKPLINPYTRDNMDSRAVVRLYKLARMLFPAVTADMPTYPVEPADIGQVEVMPETAPVDTTSRSRPEQGPIPRSNAYRRSMRKLAEMDDMSIHQRMVELFIEFDLLGNYTNYMWLRGLSRDRVVRLNTELQNTWQMLPADLRDKICVLGDPYDVFRVQSAQTIGEPEALINCVSIMELMTYCGETTEDQKMGVMHILRALCEVSDSARRALPHLL